MNEEKRIKRKQLKALSLLIKHEKNIELSEEEEGNGVIVSRFVFVSNGGLMCQISFQQLWKLFSSFGEIRDMITIAERAYALIEFKEEKTALEAVKELNHRFCEELNRQLILVFLSQKVFNQVLNNNKESIEKHFSYFECKPKGLQLIEEFITSEEEENVFKFTNSLLQSVDPNNKMKNRLVRHFGFQFDYSTNKIKSEEPIERIPEEYDFILNRLLERKLIEELPDQLTVNCYFAGNGIPAHTDTHSMCENCIISLSIGSDVVMQFRNPLDGDRGQANVFLPKRSLLLMRDESRYLWTHCITPSKSDVVVIKTEDNRKRLSLSERTTRISLTFRKVKRNECLCGFPLFCDSQNKRKEEEIRSEEKSSHLETQFVHKVYDAIASHFSDTRYKPWPKVSQFLHSLKDGALVLDVGCGNGKYLNVNPNILIIGCDRSQPLLAICRQRQREVFVGDCLQLSSVRRNAFDACICIAVIHHLSSHQRRVKALQSIIDLLVINGTALVYVWAFEQHKDGADSQYLKNKSCLMSSEDNREYDLCVHQNGTQFQSQELLVPWKTTQGGAEERQLRYYHVFRDGELRSLVSCVPNAEVLDLYYDSGNWSTILRRIE